MENPFLGRPLDERPKKDREDRTVFAIHEGVEGPDRTSPVDRPRSRPPSTGTNEGVRFPSAPASAVSPLPPKYLSTVLRRWKYLDWSKIRSRYACTAQGRASVRFSCVDRMDRRSPRNGTHARTWPWQPRRRIRLRLRMDATIPGAVDGELPTAYVWKRGNEVSVRGRRAGSAKGRRMHLERAGRSRRAQVPSSSEAFSATASKVFDPNATDPPDVRMHACTVIRTAGFTSRRRTCDPPFVPKRCRMQDHATPRTARGSTHANASPLHASCTWIRGCRQWETFASRRGCLSCGSRSSPC